MWTGHSVPKSELQTRKEKVRKRSVWCRQGTGNIGLLSPTEAGEGVEESGSSSGRTRALHLELGILELKSRWPSLYGCETAGDFLTNVH